VRVLPKVKMAQTTLFIPHVLQSKYDFYLRRSKRFTHLLFSKKNTGGEQKFSKLL
jgi:hypothetical protein